MRIAAYSVTFAWTMVADKDQPDVRSSRHSTASQHVQLLIMECMAVHMHGQAGGEHKQINVQCSAAGGT
jgi:hypothetical protein